jgi:hypothetical protein
MSFCRGTIRNEKKLKSAVGPKRTYHRVSFTSALRLHFGRSGYLHRALEAVGLLITSAKRQQRSLVFAVA